MIRSPPGARITTYQFYATKRTVHQVFLAMARTCTPRDVALHAGIHLTPNATLIADKTYDNHRLRHALRALKIRPCIQVRKGQWDDDRFDPRIYPQRNIIERLLARLKGFRCIAMHTIM